MVFVATGFVAALAIGFMVWRYGVSVTPTPTSDAGPQQVESSASAPVSPSATAEAATTPLPADNSSETLSPARPEVGPAALSNDPLVPPHASIGSPSRPGVSAPMTGITETAAAATIPHPGHEGSSGKLPTRPDAGTDTEANLPPSAPTTSAVSPEVAPTPAASKPQVKSEEAGTSEPSHESSPTGVIDEPTAPLLGNAPDFLKLPDNLLPPLGFAH